MPTMFSTTMPETEVAAPPAARRGIDTRSFAPFDQREASTRGDAHHRFPICREFNLALRLDLPEFLDGLAISSGWHARRSSEDRLVLEPPGALIECAGTSRRGCSSCWFRVWTASVEHFNFLKVEIALRAGRALITQPTFTLEWYFRKSSGEFAVAAIEEQADYLPLDQAYPQIDGGVAGFIEDFLASTAAVLVLHGPPGTGKTRLIRAILGAMSRRLGARARAMVIGEARVLESGEIFSRFLAGSADALVIEDAEHLLRPGAGGTGHLRRLLAIADGVAQAGGRKIMLSGSVPEIEDADAALIRPGRCYARVQMRELTLDEADRLLIALAADDARAVGLAARAARAAGRSTMSLAEVYQVSQDARQRLRPVGIAA